MKTRGWLTAVCEDSDTGIQSVATYHTILHWPTDSNVRRSSSSFQCFNLMKVDGDHWSWRHSLEGQLLITNKENPLLPFAYADWRSLTSLPCPCCTRVVEQPSIADGGAQRPASCCWQWWAARAPPPWAPPSAARTDACHWDGPAMRADYAAPRPADGRHEPLGGHIKVNI